MRRDILSKKNCRRGRATVKRLCLMILTLLLLAACAAGSRSDVLSVNGQAVSVRIGQVIFRENDVVLPLQRVLEGLGADRTDYRDSKNSKEVLYIEDRYFVFDNLDQKLYLMDRDVYDARGSSLYNIMLEEYSVLPAPVESDDCYISWANGVLLDQNTLTALLQKAGITVTITADPVNSTVSVDAR